MALHVRCEEADKTDCCVYFSGTLDEDAWNQLNQLNSITQKNVTLSLKDLDYINSLGVRNWISFLSLFVQNRSVVFTECPSHFIKQLNMIPRLTGDAEIASFYGDFYCSNCDEEKQMLFRTENGYETLVSQLNQAVCQDCNESLEFEEEQSTYFEFLQRNPHTL